MKKIIMMAAMAASALTMSAQETYENAKVTDKDLNGTARYVGMGGALDALGADISTISTNPAGLGLFRKSMVSISGGANMVEGNKVSGLDNTKTTASLDQLGFVWSNSTSRGNYVNFAFNYSKSKNYNNQLSTGGELYNASQNKLSSIKNAAGLGNPKDDTFSQIDYLYDKAFYGGDYPLPYLGIHSDEFLYERKTSGGVSNFDFAISGNSQNRFFWGVGVGLKYMNYRQESAYAEQFSDDYGGVGIADTRKISGYGVDFTLGAILRPIETSPFRIGLSIKTPTMYDLTTDNTTTMYQTTGYGNARVTNSESYDYKIETPWTFGVSLGHTVGNYLALGASYEYADYGAIKTRINDGGHYDYYGDWVNDSHNDRDMNNHTSSTLKGVSTIKLGAEIKPIPEIAVRLGYNYISPKYSKDGYKDVSLYSPGNYYSSSTDYTNWEATNRFTCGVGFNLDKHFSVDVAYQYTTTKGKFYPFTSFYATKDIKENNIVDAVKVKDDRHNLLVSLTYKF